MPDGAKPHSIDDRLVTDEEVAHKLGITLKQAKWLVQRKRLPVVRMGRRNRVRKIDLDAYYDSLQPINGHIDNHPEDSHP